VAERVAREGMQHGLRPFVSSMNDFKIDKLALEWSHSDVKGIVIFIAATTGQGDTPDNMKEFWKFLCKAQWGPEFLSKMKYGVIGLGDSSYEKYNFVGKKLYRRLRQLGATPTLDICLGDDQHDLGYHAAVSPWMEKFWTLLGNEWNLLQNNIQTCERISKFQMKEDGKFEDNGTLSLEYDKNISNFSALEIRKVIGNERITSKEHWQDTRLITIDLEGSSISFNPGT
jgi:sulfite reductase alpha subunit-like flavoprotein